METLNVKEFHGGKKVQIDSLVKCFGRAELKDC